jgi:predicted membrane protein
MESIFVIAAVVVVLYIVFKLFKTLLKWLVIVVVVVAAIAYFSNPDSKAHKDKLMSTGKELSHDIKGTKFDDYKIFSLTRKKVNGEEKIVGVGAFGKVWYFDDKNK